MPVQSSTSDQVQPKTGYYLPKTSVTCLDRADQYANRFHDTQRTQTFHLWMDGRSTFTGPYLTDFSEAADHLKDHLDLFRAQVVGRPSDHGTDGRARYGLNASRVPGLSGILFTLYFLPPEEQIGGGGGGGGGAQGALGLDAWGLDEAKGGGGGRGGGEERFSVHDLAPPAWHEALLRDADSKDFARINTDYKRSGHEAGNWIKVLTTSLAVYAAHRTKMGRMVGELRVERMDQLTLELAASMATLDTDSGVSREEFLAHFRPEGMRLPCDPKNLFVFTPELLMPKNWGRFRRPFDEAPEFLVANLVAQLHRKEPTTPIADIHARIITLSIPDVVQEPRSLHVLLNDARESREPANVVRAHLHALALAPPPKCYGPALRCALKIPILGPRPPLPQMTDAGRVELGGPEFKQHETHITWHPDGPAGPSIPIGASYFFTFAMRMIKHLGMAPKTRPYLLTLITLLASGLDPVGQPGGLSTARFVQLQYGPQGKGKTTIQNLIKMLMPADAIMMLTHVTERAGTTGNQWDHMTMILDEALTLLGINRDVIAQWKQGFPNLDASAPSNGAEQIFRANASGTRVGTMRTVQFPNGSWGQEQTESEPPGAILVAGNAPSLLQFSPPVQDRLIGEMLLSTNRANADSITFVSEHASELVDVLAYAKLTMSRAWAFNCLRSVSERAGIAPPITMTTFEQLLGKIQIAFNTYTAYPLWTDRRRDLAIIAGSVLMRFAHPFVYDLPLSVHSFDPDATPIAFSDPSTPQARDVTLSAALLIRFDPVHEAFVGFLKSQVRNVLSPQIQGASLRDLLTSLLRIPESQRLFHGSYLQLPFPLDPVASQNQNDHATQHAYLKQFVSKLIQGTHFKHYDKECVYRMVFEFVHDELITTKHGSKTHALLIMNGQIYVHSRILLALSPVEALRTFLDDRAGVVVPTSDDATTSEEWSKTLVPWTEAEKAERAALERDWP